MKIYREIGSMPLVIQPDEDGFFRPVYEIEVDEDELIKHGHWMDSPINVECSVCGWYGHSNGDSYCSHCGAKMDEVTK